MNHEQILCGPIRDRHKSLMDRLPPPGRFGDADMYLGIHVFSNSEAEAKKHDRLFPGHTAVRHSLPEPDS